MTLRTQKLDGRWWVVRHPHIGAETVILIREFPTQAAADAFRAAMEAKP